MELNKMKSVGFINPASNTSGINGRESMYSEEKEALKKSFAGFENIQWSDPEMQKKLSGFAKQIITTTADTVNQTDLISMLFPVDKINPGDTLVWNELSGANVYYGTYGAAVRMSRPQFTRYTVTPQLKEVGLKLDLTQIQTGKYSASELANYVSGLVTAWRNRLLFVTTLAGMSVYSSGGDQYQAGTNIAQGTMTAAFAKLTDESDAKMIVGRRSAIHQLSDWSSYSNDTRREFEKMGQVGTYAGIPVMKVNSFTDNDYGTVYPMPANEVWIFSDLPAGRVALAGGLRTSDETILRNETQNIYFRWDDGIGIWKTDRIVRCAVIT